jgi:hypothetical protein
MSDVQQLVYRFFTISEVKYEEYEEEQPEQAIPRELHISGKYTNKPRKMQ